MFNKVISSSFLVFFLLFLPFNTVQGDGDPIGDNDNELGIDWNLPHEIANQPSDERRWRWPPDKPMLRGEYRWPRVRNQKLRQEDLDERRRRWEQNRRTRQEDSLYNLDEQLYNAIKIVSIPDSVSVKALLEAGANPNVRDDKDGKTVLHYVREKDRRTAIILIEEGGADPTITDNDGNLAPVVKANPDLLESYLMSQKEETRTSCQYITEPSQIQDTQCGRRRLCIATKVSCTFGVGIEPNTTQAVREFQVVCPSLPNGQCPSANYCVLDRSVVKAEPPSSSSPSAPQSSSKGGGGAGFR